MILDTFNSSTPMVTIKCFLLFAEDLEDVNIVHIMTIPRALTFSWLLIGWYSLILAPGSMKSPNRTGCEGMTSSKVVPNSSIIFFIRLSNQVRSSLLTRRSQKTRQLSWYHSLSRATLSWQEIPAKYPHERSREVLRALLSGKLVPAQHVASSTPARRQLEWRKNWVEEAAFPSPQKQLLSKQLLCRELITASANPPFICPYVRLSLRDLNFVVFVLIFTPV